MAIDQSDRDFFTHQLQQSKQRFDTIIEAYWRESLPDIRATRGTASALTMQAFADIMNRGGKRIRATLCEQAYRMFGGTDQAVIDRAGLALEMVHAYLLVIDDISDQSDIRRGGPSAHRALEAWHRRDKLAGDSIAFGANMATLAAMTGLHMAMELLSTLPVDADLDVGALRNLNDLLTATCHGQINDLYNQATATQDVPDVEHVLIWKTAYYSFVNPLQLGGILAHAPHDALAALERYGLAAGRAFQISDDIIGLFGTTELTGKNPADDIREGKRTLLILRALERANSQDAAFLEAQLGNSATTETDVQRCRRIITGSGALTVVQQDLDFSCEQAHESLEFTTPVNDNVRFLRGLTDYLKTREA